MTLAKRTEKGLLTPDNCVVALIDLQPQMLFGVANFGKAKAAGVDILVPSYATPEREAAVVQFPGGYIAEIHSISRK